MASFEPVHRYQLHLVSSVVSVETPNRLHIAVLSHSSASAVVADPVVHLQPHDLFHEPHIIERIEAASAKAFA